MTLRIGIGLARAILNFGTAPAPRSAWRNLKVANMWDVRQRRKRV